MSIRTASELAAVDDPAWPTVLAWVASAPTPVHIVDLTPERGAETLYRLQVSAASTLGALALHSGGIIADHGWFRLLGAGGSGLTDLASINGLPENPANVGAPPGYLIVGFDALGGRFAIDGGELGISPGEVCYFGPDTLKWEGMGGGHSAFVEAALSGSLSEAFSTLRWEGWQTEIAALEADEGLSLWPPPFSTQGRDCGAASRRPVPFGELLAFYDEAAHQLAIPG